MLQYMPEITHIPYTAVLHACLRVHAHANSENRLARSRAIALWRWCRVTRPGQQQVAGCPCLSGGTAEYGRCRAAAQAGAAAVAAALCWGSDLCKRKEIQASSWAVKAKQSTRALKLSFHQGEGENLQ